MILHTCIRDLVKNVSASSPNHCILPLVSVYNPKLWTSVCHFTCIAVTVTCTAHVINKMSVSGPSYCFQVQVGPVITKGEGTVGECSDRSIVRMQSRNIVVSPGSRQVLTLDTSVLGTYVPMVCTSCHVSYAFFLVIRQHAKFKYQRFRKLCLFNLHRRVGTNVFPSHVPVACIWVIVLHSLFLHCDPPPPRHPPSDWLRLFSSQTV
jgi:hypothetical protein